MQSAKAIDAEIARLQQEKADLMSRQQAFEKEIAWVDEAEAKMRASYQQMREDIAARHGIELGKVNMEDLPEVSPEAGVDSAPPIIVSS